VFNGDLGVIRQIDREVQEVQIEFRGGGALGQDLRRVKYDYADLNEIGLAWAISVHKSQGSEYPVVILPLYPQHFMLLSRNLFYTALTRARQLAILVGPKSAMAMAVNQVKEQQRYTYLARRLQSSSIGASMEASMGA
jgi:exodeoxyribonuclease V alpha subunit